jgi:hypothetical protein
MEMTSKSYLSSLNGPGEYILDEETKRAVPSTWERAIKHALDIVPYIGKFIVKVPQEFMGRAIEAVLAIQKEMKREGYTDKDIKRGFKILTDERILGHYQRKGYVSQETFNKIKREKKNQKISLRM